MYLFILRPNYINARSFLFPLSSLRYLYKASFSIRTVRSEVWNSIVNIVYTEDSGNAIPSVRLCDHK